MECKIEQAVLLFTKKIIKKDGVTITHFADGCIFAKILERAEGFRMGYSDIDPDASTWMVMLKNLKTLLQKIEGYFSSKHAKGIVTSDINLLLIAKNQNKQEILKYFEVILAVLTESSNKQQHISVITSFPEDIQSTFIQLIQRIIEKRIIERVEPHEHKLIAHITQAEEENRYLHEQIQIANEKIDNLTSELASIKAMMEEKEKDICQLIDKFSQSPEEAQTSLIQHYEEMKMKNDSLQIRIQDQSRIHQMEYERMKDEVYCLRQKLEKLEDVEDMLLLYKEKYNEALVSLGGIKHLEKQKSTLRKMLGQKDYALRKMNEKVEELMAENFSLKEQEVELQMEIERSNVRYVQFEKVLNKKISQYSQKNNTSSENTNVLSISDHMETDPLSVQLQELSIMGIQDVKMIKRDLDKTTKKFRELEKENFRLRRLSDRFIKLEEEKKKLERMIYAQSQERREEIFLLISSISDLHVQVQTLTINKEKYLKLLQTNKLIE